MNKSNTKEMRVAMCCRLKSIIEKRNLNFDALASEIGVKSSSLRRILDGRFDFNISVLLALVDTLRIDFYVVELS